MAKKVVATLQNRNPKKFIKVIKMLKSPKSGSYFFSEKIISSDEVDLFLKD